MAQRVLVTGNMGYIGSVLAPYLAARGFEVTGLDVGYFDACTFVADLGKVDTIRKDVRDVTAKDLEGFDAVVHLAALSNDPIGNLNASWTRAINGDATVQLARLAKGAGVTRFLFSSSCIMYGDARTERVDETSPLDPKTEYARSKVVAEEGLKKLASDDFSPVYVRNGTVYGASPRMRFDTVLNDMVAQAVTTGKVQVYSDGRPWRPVSHVKDVARYFEHLLNAPKEKIHDEAFNAGAEHLNHQVRELAQIVADEIPGTEVQILAQAGADQRTYKADFTKFAKTFPDFAFDWNARTGTRELHDAYVRAGLDEDGFHDKRFTRLTWLRHLLATGSVSDHDLRWNATGPTQEVPAS